MKLELLRRLKIDPQTQKKSEDEPRPLALRVRTAVRAGDVYMHNPRGSNDH